MKKKIMMTGGAVVAATVLGLGIYHSNASQADTLSTADIKQMVQDQYPGTITEIELEKSNNKSEYEVEIEGDNKSYDLTLNAETGEVLNLEEKTVFTDQDDDNKLVVKEKEKDDQAAENKQDKKNDQKQTGQAASKEQSAKKEQPQQNSQDQGMIGSDEASRIALNEFSGTVMSVELDEDDGRMIYEIEIETKNEEAELEIDAYTGNIIVLEIDRDDDDDDND